MSEIIKSQAGAIVNDWKKVVRKVAEDAKAVVMADAYEKLIDAKFGQLVSEMALEANGGKKSALAAALNPSAFVKGYSAFAAALVKRVAA